MTGPGLRRVVALSAAAAFLLVLVVGLATRGRPPLLVPAERAARIAAQAPELRDAARRADRTEVVRVDKDLERVTFLRDGRQLGTAGVRRDGRVFQAMAGQNHQGYGTALAHSLVVLAALTLIFLLAVLRRPLRPVPTIDALALAGFVVPTVLVDRGFVVAGQATATLLLAYVAARGIAVATGRLPRPAGRILLDLPRAHRRPRGRRARAGDRGHDALLDRPGRRRLRDHGGRDEAPCMASCPTATFPATSSTATRTACRPTPPTSRSPRCGRSTRPGTR